jgi:hypothetical protein
VFLGLKWPRQLAGVGGFIRNEFQNIVDTINAWSNVEHNDDGTHRDITADSVTVAHGGQFGDTLVALTRGGNAPRTPVAQGDNLAMGSVETPTDPSGLPHSGVATPGIGLRWPQSPASGQWAANAGAWFLAVQDYSQVGGGVGAVKDLAVGHKDAANGAIVRLLKHLPTHGHWALIPDRVTNLFDGVSLGAPSFEYRFREIHGHDVNALSGYFERGRTTRMGDWEAYTPTWASTGTQPALGNGTIAGRYTKIGNTVHAIVTLTVGSTTTFGTGAWSFSMPSTMLPLTTQMAGAGTAIDTSDSGKVYGLVVRKASTTTVFPYNILTSTILSASSPFTWAQGDVLTLQVTYEEA